MEITERPTLSKAYFRWRGRGQQDCKHLHLGLALSTGIALCAVVTSHSPSPGNQAAVNILLSLSVIHKRRTAITTRLFMYKWVLDRSYFICAAKVSTIDRSFIGACTIVYQVGHLHVACGHPGFNPWHHIEALVICLFSCDDHMLLTALLYWSHILLRC